MTALDRHTRLATEQQLIRDATQRLLAGTPQRSNGSLTIATLATEAGLARHRIYEHHADLVAEFKATTHTGTPIIPGVQALRRQLADAHERIEQLETTQTQLTAKITTLCAAITELTHEAHAGNVVALPQRPSTDPATPPQPSHALENAQRGQQRNADSQRTAQSGSTAQRSVRRVGPAHPTQEPGDQRADDSDRENQSKGKQHHGR